MLDPNINIRVRITHNHAGLLDLAGKLGVLGKETVTRVDHVHSVSNSNLDNLIDGKVCLNRSILPPSANSIGLIRL